VQPYPSLSSSGKQDSWQSMSVVCVCVIVSICQDRQVLDSVKRKRASVCGTHVCRGRLWFGSQEAVV